MNLLRAFEIASLVNDGFVGIFRSEVEPNVAAVNHKKFTEEYMINKIMGVEAHPESSLKLLGGDEREFALQIIRENLHLIQFFIAREEFIKSKLN